MKTIFIIFSVLMACSTYAQDKPSKSTSTSERTISEEKSPEYQAKLKTHKLAELLNLSSEQQTRVYEVLINGEKQQYKAKQRSTDLNNQNKAMTTQDLKASNIKAQKKMFYDINRQFKQIFTPDQYELYEKTYLKSESVQKKTKTD